MGNSVGLPAVPTGLSRDLSIFLQALAENVRILAGSARGASGARAVRASEANTLGTGTSVVGQNAIGTANVKAKSITSDKLADNSVTEAKLAMSSVSARTLQAGAVTTDKIALAAVSTSKLAEGVLPVLVEGIAADGEQVEIPVLFVERPTVCLTSIHALSDKSGILVGYTELFEIPAGETNTGAWGFVACGTFAWAAIGYKK